MSRRISGIVALALLALGLVSFATANPADPAPFLRSLADQAVSVIRDDNLQTQDRKQAFRTLLRRGFDIEAVGQFVLGRYWQRADADQRAAFLATFEDYVVSTYAARLGRYGGEQLVIVNESREGDGSAIVISRIDRPDAQPIRVDWRLHNRDGEWRIVDIKVEGVSLLVAQRSEFASVIRANGGDFGGLVQVLQRKVAQLEATN